jgi:uncharacterized RDD family membrane protein YckC
MALFLDLAAILAATIAFALLELPLGAAGPFVFPSFLASYFIGFTASPLQGTPGKRLMGIKVTDLAGNRLGLVHSLARFAASLASIALAGLGLALAAWTQRRQSLHDLAARTLVVRAQAAPGEVATAGSAPCGWGTRIGFTGAILFIALAVYALVTLQSAHVRREAMLELLTQMNDYRREVEAALAERRPLPPAPKASGNHARELRIAPDGTIVLEAGGFFEGGRLVYSPRADASGKITWKCSASGIEERHLFPACRAGSR